MKSEERLDHLYDALETGSFTGAELAPRSRKLQDKRSNLAAPKQEADLQLESNVFEMPDIRVVNKYVQDLQELLASSPIIEQSNFLKSFVKEIHVDVDTITINHNLPIPPNTQETENIGVLPFLPVSGLLKVFPGKNPAIYLFLLIF